MFLFKKNNNKKTNKRFNDYDNSIESFLGRDEYISFKDLQMFKKDWNQFFEELDIIIKTNMLKNYCKINSIKENELMDKKNQFDNINKIIQQKNNDFIIKQLKTDKEYLDNILSNSDSSINLDKDQRIVVLTEEENTLVIAGAGSGKTTTIEAKVKYLVEKKSIKPEEILIISYTREATNELKDRIQKKLKINAKISTFHSIGNEIIRNENEQRHDIKSFGFLIESLEEYFRSKIEDETFIQKTLLFFASYLEVYFDDEDIEALHKKLQKDNITTLKEDLKEKIDNFIVKRTKSKITIKSERVNSIQEARIANYLYINGFDYEYQPLYQYQFKNTTKPYLPDFVIKQDGEEYYLEHFALSEDGVNNRFSKEEQEKYKKHINDKVALHRDKKTKLIYTFSKYKDDRDLIIHLEELLRKNGLKFNKINNKEIYKRILETAQDRYFYRLIQLIGNFINLIKVNNWNQDKILELKITAKDERTKIFLDIAYECFLIYEHKLKEAKAIDFEDMINNASNILDSYINSGEKLPYKYIFIDEYQDISLQRFDLAKKLSDASNAKIIAVGDDWQSIFKFAGGNISLFTEFEKNMGNAIELKISNTYRNSQELIDIAGTFVQKNKEQIKKELSSTKSIKNPVIIVSYDDVYRKEEEKTPFAKMCEAIEKSITEIVNEYGEDKKILLIGRFNIDGKNLEKSNLFRYYEGGKVVSIKHPKTPITFSTVHRAKGLGFDNVILINAKDAYMGFPSKIEDDPVIKLVIKDTEEIEYAEERRLFYVALTRTKNRVYIIVPENNPSKFVLEIKDKFKNIILKGKMAQSNIQKNVKRCPLCGYPLQLRQNKQLKSKIWICSNEPEQCGFITNNIKGGKLGISKCPDCFDGYLVVKEMSDDKGKFILGCNNYKPNKTGCNYVIMPNEFTYDKDKLKFNNDILGKKKIYYNMDIYDILETILKSINELDVSYPNARFGIRVNIQILKGESNKVIDAFELKDFEFYGMLSKVSFTFLERIINSLIALDVLVILTDHEYEKLMIGPKKLTELSSKEAHNLINLRNYI